MSKDPDGQDITQEQLADVYAAGTSDGIFKTENGLIRIDQDGKVHEQVQDEEK